MPVSLRPARELQTGVGASPLAEDANGAGGGLKFTHAALTLPSRTARLNARLSLILPSDMA
jgi:hypothetical protein